MSTSRSIRRRLVPAIPLALLAITSAHEAAAQPSAHVWWVANNGLDSAQCGAYSTPCRSIGRAIERAASGDTILVGPGRYGDLNSNGDFNDPGDEHPNESLESLIPVTKSLRILSTDGPYRTFIDVRRAPDQRLLTGFQVLGGNDTVIGGQGRGFTVLNGNAAFAVNGSDNVRVVGNISVDNSDGFTFGSEGGPLAFVDNISFNDQRAFGGTSDGLLLEGNIAIATRFGAFGGGGIGLRLIDNIAVQAGDLGFSLGCFMGVAPFCKHSYEHNIAIANGDGFGIVSDMTSFRHNAAIGNLGIGAMFFVPQSTALSRNDFFGNNTVRRDLGSFQTLNCGFSNLTTTKIRAPLNYWGAPTGPGPDPADNAGPACDDPAATTIVQPVAQHAFTVDTGHGGGGHGGRTLRVANDGLDSSTCGGSAQACRSIGQAIENASAGDTIEVGPGRYGDLDRDGDFSDPGDEHGPLTHPDCMVCVTKAVRIVSTQGSVTTVIDAQSALLRPLTFVVDIFASNAQFGAAGRGFTITHGQYGIRAEQPADNVQIAGNLIMNNQFGGVEISVTTTIVLTDNIATHNPLGFQIGVGNDSLLKNNLAIANSVLGFSVQMSAGGRVIGNIAAQNGVLPTGDFDSLDGIGFAVGGGALVFKDNLALDNAGAGFRVYAAAGTSTIGSFRRNTILGNRGPGVLLKELAVIEDMHQNDIYGNDTRDPASSGNPFTNCGVVNQSGLPLLATQNFWGRAQGPGAAEPADNAGGVCDLGAGHTTTVPFATTAFHP